MVSLTEVIRALAGIGRLIRLDRQGLDYFDRTIQGFWRSFAVALLVAPFYALLIPQRIEAAKPTVGWPYVMAIETLTYAIRWLLYPTIAFELCRWLKRQSEYPGYITIYNWSAILSVGIQLLVWLPSYAGLTAAEFSQNLHIAAYCLLQIYWWFIAREALKVDGIVAVGLVFTNFALMLILSAAHMALLRPSL